MNTNYDVIIIGSGVGGLATASLLSKFSDKKILIIEQHSKIGGYSHSFRRKKYQWDVGSHYIGDMNEQSIIRKLFDEITDGNLKWESCPPGSLNFKYPNLNFEFPNSPEEYQDLLTLKFPSEKESILEYLRDLRNVCSWSNQRILRNSLPNRLHSILPQIDSEIEKIALTNLEKYFNKKQMSLLLRQYLEAHWGAYGLISSQTSFFAHAIITNHYLNGLYRPVNGSETIAKLCEEVITARKSKIIKNTVVTKINISKNTAIAVQAYNKTKKSLETYNAPIIISNAGVQNTYKRLLSTSSINITNGLKITAITLFIGMKENPEIFGLSKMCYWIFSHDSHDKNLNYINEKGEFAINMAGIMSPMRKENDQNYSIQIFIPIQEMNLDFWHRLNEENYLKLKYILSEKILQFAEKHFPSFSKYVDYYELATPLTFSKYNHNFHGEIYGQLLDNYRFSKEFEDSLSSIDGLYFTGTDVTYPGIAGAALSGLVTASKILPNSNLIKFFSNSFYYR